MYPEFNPDRHVLPRWRYLLARLMLWRWRQMSRGVLVRR
jgi:hypothetical protein